MSKIAVIKTGGKQYLAKEKDKLKIEKLKDVKDGKISFETLLVSEADGKGFKMGTPVLKDLQVNAKVLTDGRAKKVRVVTYKNKTRQYTVKGHRQPFTQVEITKIS